MQKMYFWILNFFKHIFLSWHFWFISAGMENIVVMRFKDHQQSLNVGLQVISLPAAGTTSPFTIYPLPLTVTLLEPIIVQVDQISIGVQASFHSNNLDFNWVNLLQCVFYLYVSRHSYIFKVCKTYANCKSSIPFKQVG